MADSHYALQWINNKDKNDDSLISIEIHNNAWIGMRVVLLEGASMGKALLWVRVQLWILRFPPYAIVAGLPGKINGRVKK